MFLDDECKKKNINRKFLLENSDFESRIMLYYKIISKYCHAS